MLTQRDHLTRLGRTLPNRITRAATLPLLGAALLMAGAGPAAASSSPTAYVGNYGAGTVTPVDTASNLAGAAITVGANPYAIAITPDGRTAYVADFAASNTTTTSTVIPVTLATGTPGAPIPVGINPAGIAITPDGRTAYVANYGSGTVTPIALATGTPGPAIPVGANPWGIAITPDGRTAYVANYGSATVTPISLPTSTPGSPIAVGTKPVAVSVTPDGATVYVLGNATGTLTPITVATNTPRNAIVTGAMNPWGMAITPDGRTLDVADYGGGRVIPISLATGTVGTPVLTGGNPTGIAISPDQARAYVANLNAAWLNPITLATGVLGPGIGTGATNLTPYPVTFSPDQAPIAAFRVAAAPAGLPSSFDASASTVAVGTITSYAWDFGDGQTATTSGPTATHTYTTAGTYTARLTETDSAGTSTARVFTGQSVIRDGGPSAQTSQVLTVSPAVPAPPTATPGPPASTSVPPTAVPPSGVVAPAPVTLAGGSLTATARGYVAVRLGCPASAPTACRGTLTITLARPGRTMTRLVVAVTSHCARGCRPLGQTQFLVHAGQTQQLALRLSAPGRALLAHRRSLRVQVAIVSTAFERRTVTEHTLTLHAPARRTGRAVRRRGRPDRS